MAEDQNIQALKQTLKQEAELNKQSFETSNNPALEHVGKKDAPAPPLAPPVESGILQTGLYVGDSQYDKGIAVNDLPYVDKIRHERQGGLAQTFNMLNQAITGEIVGGMIEGIGYLTDVQDILKTVAGNNEEWGNWMSDIGKGLKEWTREATPIYKDPDAPGFDPLSYSWWMSHMPSVASTISLMIPAVGTVGLLSKAGKALSIGQALGKVGKGLGMGEKATKIANTIAQGTGTAIISRQMESMMEASGTWESAYEEAKAKGITDEDTLKDIASSAAQRNYALNWVMLLQDIPQYMLLGKAFPKTVGNSVSKARHLGQSIFKPLGSKVGLISMDAAWEGVEEGYQFISDEESKHLAFERAGLISKDGPDFTGRLGKYTSDGEFWSAAFFGAMGGALMQTAGKPISQAISGDASALKAKFGNLKERANRALGRGDKDTSSETGQTGHKDFTPTTQVEDIKDWGKSYSAIQHEARRAIEWGTRESQQQAGERAAEALMIRAAEKGNMDALQLMFETMKNPSEKDLKMFGFEGMSAEDIQGFQQMIPQYQQMAKKVNERWNEIAQEMKAKGEFISAPQAASAAKVSLRVQQDLTAQRVDRNIKANDTKIAQIEQETPIIRDASDAIKEVIRTEAAIESVQKMRKSLKTRFDTGEMTGVSAVGYEQMIAQTEAQEATLLRILEESKKKLKAKEKKDLSLIKGSVRYPKYRSLLTSNTVLQLTGMLNAYEERAVADAIAKTAAEFRAQEEETTQAVVGDQDGMTEIPNPAENNTETEQTKTEAEKQKDNEDTVVEETKTREEKLNEELDKVKKKGETAVDSSNAEETDVAGENKETQEEAAEEQEKKKDGLLKGAIKLVENEPVDTALDEGPTRGENFLPEEFPFDPDKSFEQWASEMYNNKKYGGKSLARDILGLKNQIDQEIKEIHDNGGVVPQELIDLSSSLLLGSLTGTQRATAEQFIEFVNKYTTVATDKLGPTQRIITRAIDNLYAELFRDYGPRIAITAKQIKDYHRNRKRAIENSKGYDDSQSGDNNSDKEFFTNNSEYAMRWDDERGEYFVITDEDGKPLKKAKIGNKVFRGDNYKELDWDTLNNGNFEGNTVYFEFDAGGIANGDRYDSKPGDFYNSKLLADQYPEEVLRGTPADVQRHRVQHQTIWIVTHDDNGNRVVLGSLPAGTAKRTSIRGLRNKLDVEFQEEFKNKNLVQHPRTNEEGRVQGLQSRFVRARTTSTVEQQLPGRLYANTVAENMLSGAEILDVIPKEDLHILIWNGEKFIGNIERVGRANPDIIKSIQDGNNKQFTPGAAYVFLKSSRPGHYIPTRLYNYLEIGEKVDDNGNIVANAYMNKVVDLLLELEKPNSTWSDISEELKQLVYATYDIRLGRDRKIHISHTNQKGEVVVTGVSLDEGTRVERRNALMRALNGRFAMIDQSKLNMPASDGETYNERLIKGTHLGDEFPIPFIKSDVYNKTQRTKPDGTTENIYTHSTKFKINMPSMAVVPMEGETTQEDFIEDAVIIEETEETKEKVNRLFANGTFVEKNGRRFFRNNQGRLGVIVNVGGMELPFYQSKGQTGGKTTNWTPFYGNTGSWLIKSSIDNINNGLGIEEIQDTMSYLDTMFPEYLPASDYFTAEQKEILRSEQDSEALGKLQLQGNKQIFPEVALSKKEVGQTLSSLNVINYDINTAPTESSEAAAFVDAIEKKIQDYFTATPEGITPGITREYESNPELVGIGTLEEYEAYLKTIFPDSKIKGIMYHGKPGERFDAIDFAKLKAGEAFYVTPYRDYAQSYAKKAGKAGVVVAVLINAKNIKSLTGAYAAIKEQIEDITNYISDLEQARDGKKFAIEIFTEDGIEIKIFNSKKARDEAVKNNSGFEVATIESINEVIANKEQRLAEIAETGTYDTIKTNIEGTNDGIYAVFEKEQVHILGSKADITGFRAYMAQAPATEKQEAQNRLDHKEVGVTDNEEKPVSKEDIEQQIEDLRKSNEKTKGRKRRRNLGIINPSDERTLMKDRLRDNKTVMSKAEQEWFRTIFPGVPLEILDTVKHVVTTGGEKAWAVFQDAVVRVVDTAPAGVLYHEAFHAVFVLGLNADQRAAILTEAKEMYVAPTKEQLDAIKKQVEEITTDEQATDRYYEEMLAEEFREYALTKGIPARTLKAKVKKWFRQLLAFGRRLFRNKVSVKGLFYDIHNGVYTINKLPKHAKNVAAYMSQNDPNTLSSKQTKEAVDEVNSIFITMVSEIAMEKFGTQRPHLDQVLEVIREYNVGPDGKPDDPVNPYKGASAIYYDMALDISNHITNSIDAGLSPTDPHVMGYMKVLNSLANLETERLNPLARSAGLRLSQDFGIRTKIVTVENLDETIEVDALTEDELEDQGMDSEAEKGPVKESWGIEAGSKSKKDTASFRIKFLLANIPRLDYRGKPVIGFLGKPLLAEKSTLYNKLQRNLTLEKGNFNSTIMMEKLQGMIKSTPAVKNVIAALEADPILKAEFYSTMTTTNAGALLIWEKKLGDEQSEFRAIESNRRTVNKMIKNDWKEALDNKATTPLNGVNMTPAVRQSLVDTAVTIIDRLLQVNASNNDPSQDTLIEFSNTVRELGIHTEPEVLYNIMASEKKIVVKTYFDTYKSLLNDINRNSNPFDTSTQEQQQKSVKKNVGLQTNTNLDTIANLNADHSIFLYEQGYDNVEKKKIFAHRNTNYIARLLGKLTSSDPDTAFSEIERMQKDPFYSNNFLLNQVFGTETRHLYKYTLLDGIKREGMSKGSPFKKMGKKDMYIANINAFLNNNSKKEAWFKVTTLSDSPSSMYVKSKKVTITDAENALYDNIKQEAARIDRVRERKAQGVKPIENYDITETGKSRGNTFVFFPFMNDLIPSDYQGSVFQWVKDNPQLVKGSAKTKNTLRWYLEKNYQSFKKDAADSDAINSTGMNIDQKALDSAVGFELSKSKDESTESLKRKATDNLLRQYYWNSTLFNVNMIQIASGDLAFYKDDGDFQKRNKQIYSPGLVIDTTAEYSNEEGLMTVGSTYNSIYLEDNLINKSQAVDAIKKGLEQQVKKGEIDTQTMYNILSKYGYGYNSKLGDNQFLAVDKETGNVRTVERVQKDKKSKAYYQELDEEGKISKIVSPASTEVLYRIQIIEETDGQAYITLDRFKKIYMGLGRWNAQYEQAYQRAKKGKATPADISTVFRPLKPFYFSKHMNPESPLWVPTQNKNSEFVLLPQMTKKSKKLGTLLKYMEDNNVDSINFHSAVKVGGTNITKWSDIEGNTKPTLAQDYNPAKGEFQGVLINQNYNEDYKLQQETPDHYKDDQITFGVQISKLATADLEPGELYHVNGTDFTPEQLTQAFQDTMSAGIVMDFYYEAGKFENIEDLQQHLIEQLRANGHGDQIESAFEIVESEVQGTKDNPKKVFKISLNNPLYSKDTENLLNAAFKSSVTKRKIKGGQFVQVSSFGFTEDLKIIVGKDGGLEAMEVYMPWWTKDYFPTDANGEIDFEKIQKENPELLELIGYRIPTEDKYSMAPIRVKGFLPKEAGGSIILPAEITTISGSDFDIDKLFVMIPEFRIHKNTVKDGTTINSIKKVEYIKWKTDTDEGLEQLYNRKINQQKLRLHALIKAADDISSNNLRKRENLKKKLGVVGSFGTTIDLEMDAQLRKDISNMLENSNMKRYTPERLQSELDALPTKEEFMKTYRGTPAEFFNSKEARNNRQIDIIRSILQHPSTFNKIMNPGSFDNFKSDRQRIKDLRSKDGRVTNIILPQDDIEFSLRNNAGSQLVGIAANHNSSHAMFQHTRIGLAEDSSVDFHVLDSNGKLVPRSSRSLNESTYQYMNDQGVWSTGTISKNLASEVAMVVDNAKDPVSGDINLNTFTSDVFNLILRTGYHHTIASMFIAHPLIETIATKYYNEGATRPAADRVVEQAMMSISRVVKMKFPKLAPHNAMKEAIQQRYKPSQQMLEDHIREGEATANAAKHYMEIEAAKINNRGKNKSDDTQRLLDNAQKEADATAVSFGYSSFAAMDNAVLTEQKLVEYSGVLKHFDKLRAVGNDLSSAVSLARPDGKGAGPTMADTTIYVDKYKDTEEYPNSIVGLEELLAPEAKIAEKMHPDLKEINIPVPNKKTKEAFTKTRWFTGHYNSVHNFAEFGIVKPNEVLEEFYIWNTPAFRHARAQILKNGNTDALSAEQVREINYHMYSYIADGFAYFNQTPGEKKNIVANFPLELMEFQANNPNLVASNRILNKLNVRTDNDHPRIEFDNGSPVSKPEREELQQAWQELFEGPHRDIAVKLAKYSFHTLGFIFNPYSFGHLLNTFYYADVMKDGNKTFDDHIALMRKPGGMLDSTNKTPQFTEFIGQFLLNNSSKNEYVTSWTIQGNPPKSVTKILDNKNDAKFFYTEGKGIMAVTKPKEFIAGVSYDMTGKKTYYTYQLKRDGLNEETGKLEGHYERVNKLGIAGKLFEYRHGENAAGMTSIVASNNVPTEENEKLRGERDFTIKTRTTKIKVGSDSVTEKNAAAILQIVMNSYNAAYNRQDTLEDYVSQALTRIANNKETPSLNRLHELLGELMYDNLPESTQNVVKAYVWADPTLSAAEQHTYKMRRLGGNMASNVNKSALNEMQKLMLEPPPDTAGGPPGGLPIKLSDPKKSSPVKKVMPGKSSNTEKTLPTKINTAQKAKLPKMKIGGDVGTALIAKGKRKVTAAAGKKNKLDSHAPLQPLVDEFNKTGKPVSMDVVMPYTEDGRTIEQVVSITYHGYGTVNLANTSLFGRSGQEILDSLRKSSGYFRVSADEKRYERLDSNGKVIGTYMRVSEFANGKIDIKRGSISITSTNYTKDTPKSDPTTAYVFTENINSIGSKRVGGGSAVIRNNPNAIGIITKKYYVYEEDRATSDIKGGFNQDFKDTPEDFTLFKEYNLEQFKKISEYNNIVFPQGFGTGLAKMPTRFAEWLQAELFNRFGLITELNQSKTGLISKSIKEEDGVAEDAVAVGQAVDNITRDILSGNELSIEDLTKAGKYDSNKYSNIMSKQAYFNYVAQLLKVKSLWLSQGKIIITDRIILHNDNMGPKRNQKVAGEIDLMTIDKEGNLEIIDTKSIRNMMNYYTPFEGSTKYEKHARQVNTYRILLNNTYKLSTSGLSILPVRVSYKAGYLHEASLLPTPHDENGQPYPDEYLIALPPRMDINDSQNQSLFKAASGINGETSQTMKTSIENFDMGNIPKHIFTFNANASVNMTLNPKETKPADRLKPIPSIANLERIEFAKDRKDIVPIQVGSETVRVGSAFTSSDGTLMVTNISSDGMTFRNLKTNEIETISIADFKSYQAQGFITNAGVYPLVEFNGNLYAFGAKTYYGLNQGAERSEEIDEYIKENGVNDYNDLRTHMQAEPRKTISGKPSPIKASDLDTDYLQKYCLGK